MTYIALANYFYLQNIDTAIYYCKESEKISEQANYLKGRADSYSWLGYLLHDKGDKVQAIEYYHKTLKLDQEMGNKKGMATSYINLGVALKEQGYITQGLQYYNKSLKVLEELGDKRLIAYCYINIGMLYSNQGNFPAALKFNDKSLKLYTEIGNKRGMALAYNNIGAVYKKQGDPTEALDYYNKSLKLYKEKGDKIGVARCYNNIGVVYLMRREFPKAMEYYQLGLKKREEIGDKQGISSSYNNIGSIYFNQGDFQRALEYYQKSLKLREELDYKSGITLSYYNIGKVKKAQGDSASFEGNADFAHNKYIKAVDYFSKSLSIARNLNHAKRKEVASNALLQIYMLLDSSKKADEMAHLIRDLRLKDLQVNFSTLSEQQKEMYFATMQKDFDLLYDFPIHFPNFSKQVENAYDNALITKGLLLKSSTAMRNAIISSGDSLMINKYNDWLALKRRIAKAYAKGDDVSKMEEAANELEKGLVKGSQEFSNFKKVQKIGWKDVQKGLNEGEAAIEFIRFTHKDDYRNKSIAVELYAALIIDSKSKQPKMIRLFEESELKKILGTFPGNNISYIEQLYGTKENTKNKLYNLIWKPMEEQLRGIKKVYISPVGLLHKISFAALAKEQDVYLCDLYEMEMKSSTGKIVLSEEMRVNENNITTLFGGIEYNSNNNTTEIWSYLEGTLSETQSIEKILKKEKRAYKYFNKSNATEENFKKFAPNSNIVHIATHGFFYHDPDLISQQLVDDKEIKEELVFRGGRTGMGVSTFVKSRNPLMRSGLAFAGANDVWNTTDFEGEDGVLTAAEVATIDMRNTSLVVLSACETGLGDIKGSEGVYGLQRSFKMAGVKYLIMSLWQVPDKETAEFMDLFYKYLTKTKDIKESFNRTQMEMRKKYAPYYWAAFVLVE